MQGKLEKKKILEDKKMPQNKVTLAPGVIISFNKEKFELLEKKFKEAVIKAFNVPENDIAFTAVAALFTKGEADVQVEVNYSAGKDEYKRDKPFDPCEEEQKTLVKLFKSAFDVFCIEQNMPPMSLSVWPIPHYNTEFSFFPRVKFPKVKASIT